MQKELLETKIKASDLGQKTRKESIDKPTYQ